MNMNNKTYIISPKVLKGKSAEIHKAGRRKVTKIKLLGSRIDGIIAPIHIGSFTLKIVSDFFKPLSEI